MLLIPNESTKNWNTDKEYFRVNSIWTLFLVWSHRWTSCIFEQIHWSISLAMLLCFGWYRMIFHVLSHHDTGRKQEKHLQWYLGISCSAILQMHWLIVVLQVGWYFCTSERLWYQPSQFCFCFSFVRGEVKAFCFCIFQFLQRCRESRFSANRLLYCWQEFAEEIRYKYMM
jgi:hypothetical protein